MIKNYYESNLKIMHDVMRPGTMLYMNPRDLMTGKEETIFYIREAAEIFKKIPKSPDIYTVGAAFEIEDVVVSVIYLKIDRIDECLYEMFVNYYVSDGDGERAMYNLSVQDKIKLCFMTDNPDVERIIEIENGFKSYAKQIKEGAQKYYPGWSMQAFNRAKIKIIQEYPGRSLWNRLNVFKKY